MLGIFFYFAIFGKFSSAVSIDYFKNEVVKDDTISTNVSLSRFLLWTRQNPTSTQELIFEDLPSIINSNFDAALKTKVLVHGYTGGGTQSWVTRMRDSFLLKGN